MKFHPQRDQMDCGAACLAMITDAYGKQYPVEFLREECFLTREGVSLLGITEAAQKIGFETLSLKINVEKFHEDKNLLPCILHWNQNHFVVLYQLKGKKAGRKELGDGNFPVAKNKRFYLIADPAHGFVKLSEKDFCKSWLSNGEKGVVLFLNPLEKFYWATTTDFDCPCCV